MTLKPPGGSKEDMEYPIALVAAEGEDECTIWLLFFIRLAFVMKRIGITSARSMNVRTTQSKV
jgi:hypothetical protein